MYQQDEDKIMKNQNDNSENRKNTQIVSGRYIDYGDGNKLGLRKQSTINSRSVNPQRTNQQRDIRVEKIYNNVDHESILSGDVGDLKSILSSSKSPQTKHFTENTARGKNKSREFGRKLQDKRRNNNDSPFLRISDMGHSQSLMMGD